MWNFLYTIKCSDIVKGVDAWRETSVEAEDLVVDKGGEGEEIEEIGEVLPDVCVTILAKAFVVEAIDLGDLTRFVIATEDGNALWVSDLKGN